jgi:hypothetical protein
MDSERLNELNRPYRIHLHNTESYGNQICGIRYKNQFLTPRFPNSTKSALHQQRRISVTHCPRSPPGRWRGGSRQGPTKKTSRRFKIQHQKPQRAASVRRRWDQEFRMAPTAWTISSLLRAPVSRF